MRNHLISIALCLAIPAVAADTARIDRVENGLQPAIVIKGRPVARMPLAERLKYYRVPGVSVAVVDGGKVDWARGYGETSADGGKPVDAETLFQAASISKHVAALVALHLVDEGKLSLDENVNAKLRSWQVPENEFTKTEKVTLRRLLNHSAGLTVHGFPGYEAGAPVPSLVDLLDGKPPANTAPIRVDVTPGTLWRYSGGGYEVMQQLVLDVAGSTFPKRAQEMVLRPLAMSHSTFEQPLPKALEGNAATAHDAKGQPIKGKYHTYPEMAAAGLWTTPSDLARVVMELQTGGHVLKAATQREMLTKVLGDYGLGLGLKETDGQKSFSHGGSNAGFQCMMFGYLSGGRGAVVMTNGDRGGALADEILRSIAIEYNWPDYRPQEKAIANLDEETLKAYAGAYQFPNGPSITITVEGGRLLVKTPEGDAIEMLPESTTSFFTVRAGVPAFKFTRKEDGSVELAAGGGTAKRKSP
ncbi:MAG TPA: serine hydrolase [Bryobacteraceae bacterium]|nr:serine hydrolase [Bryobacteraceae bacterium]